MLEYKYDKEEMINNNNKTKNRLFFQAYVDMQCLSAYWFILYR